MPNYSDTPSKFGTWLVPCIAETGSTRTITPADFGKCITNRGGGALTVTLPDPATVPKGSWVKFFGVAAGNFIIQCTSKIVCLNNAAATSISWSTDGEEIGNGAEAINLGTLWFVKISLADEANTLTVA
jgi:hypothetical protein